MIFEGDRRFSVTIRLSDMAGADLQTLAQVPVPLPNGGFVPLHSVADIGVSDGPTQISREHGTRRVVVKATASSRDVARIVADAREKIDRAVRPSDRTSVGQGKKVSVGDTQGGRTIKK